MHSMLFVVAVPTDNTTMSQSWQMYRGFIGYATNNLEPFSGVERLAENVWLVNMRIDPLPLALLGSAAHQHGIGFRLLPFAEAPQWLPDATNTQSSQGTTP
jgi:hypothetical protein